MREPNTIVRQGPLGLLKKLATRLKNEGEVEARVVAPPDANLNA